MKRKIVAIICAVLFLFSFSVGCMSGESSESVKNPALDIPDFIVEIPKGKNPIILQITDTQTIDSAQRRRQDRLSNAMAEYWATDKMDERLNGYLDKIIEEVKPDLILFTGDLIYGEFDDAGTSMEALVNKIDGYGIPWAPIFGNHEPESKKGVDWQCYMLESAKNCLFKQGKVTGNGNYTVGISQGGKLTRVFFMMDSNGAGNASEESLSNGQTMPTQGFERDQVAWFEEVGGKIKKDSPETKISFAFHIQIQAFYDAYAKYGFSKDSTTPINIDTHPNKADGDFGYLGYAWGDGWDVNGAIFAKMKALGVDSIYCGHEHENSASVVFDGVRFQFGQKISTYDRCNWLMADGTIKGAYPPINGTPIMGGTVNVLNENGEIIDAYIHYVSGFENK